MNEQQKTNDPYPHSRQCGKCGNNLKPYEGTWVTKQPHDIWWMCDWCAQNYPRSQREEGGSYDRR